MLYGPQEYPLWSRRLDAVVKYILFLIVLGFGAYWGAYWAAGILFS